MTKIDRRQRRRSARRHARRDARRGTGPTYRETVRALKRVANKKGEAVKDVIGALKMRAILNGSL